MQLNPRQLYLSLVGFAFAFVVITLLQRGTFLGPKAVREPIVTPSSSAAQQLANKENILEKSTDPNTLFGFIRSMSANGNEYSIEFDEAEFIENSTPSSTGDTKPGIADLAAIEDGMCGVQVSEAHIGECASSGFYIRNNSTTTKKFLLNPSVNITVIAQSPTVGVHPQPIRLRNFQKAFLTPASPYSDPYYALIDGPYTIKLENDVVVELTSFYTP